MVYVGITGIFRQRIGSIGLLFVLLLVFTHCTSTRHLLDHQQVLRKPIIRYESKIAVSKKELRSQLPRYNRGAWLLPRWLPYVEFYQMGFKRFDLSKLVAKRDSLTRHYNHKLQNLPEGSNKRARVEARKIKRIEQLTKKIQEGNLWMRLGKPMAVYDTSMLVEAERRVRSYLLVQGYLRPQVRATARTHLRHKRLVVTVNPGPRTQVGSLQYVFEDTVDTASLKQLFEQSSLPLVEGGLYTEVALLWTTEAMERVANNHGYYGFSQDDVHFWIDTAFHKPNQVAVHVQLSPSREALRPHVWDSLSVSILSSRDTVVHVHAGLHFNTSLYHRTLRRRISLRKGDYYDRRKLVRTRYLLSRLDMFNFINIYQDTLPSIQGVPRLHARVTLSPKRKYIFGSEVGLEVRQALPSPFISFSLRARDLLRRLELIDLSIRFLVDGIGTPDASNRPYRSFEYGFTAAVLYPDIFLLRSRRLSARYLDRQTRMAYEYLSSNRIEYRRNTSQFGLSVTWRTPRNSYVQFFPIDIRLVSSVVSDTFRRQIRLFYNNFSNSFVSGIVTSVRLAAVLNRNYQLSTWQPTTALYLGASIETGGHLGFLYRQVARRNGLQQYVFSRITAEYKQKKALARRMELVWRVYGGVVVSHTRVPSFPYERLFFAGSSNTQRAWRARRLGPGGYALPDGSPSLVEQPGEMLLEANIEFRALLTKWLGIGVFADMGNIWLLQLNNPVYSAVFRFPDSFRDVAIGTGFGLRAGITFLILRLDLGIKTYDPSALPGKKWVIKDLKFQDINRSNSPFLLNFTIGYPF